MTTSPLIEYIPKGVNVMRFIGSRMTYLRGINKRELITDWIHIFVPKRPPLVFHRLFVYTTEENPHFCFYVHRSAVFLPDFITQFLQLYCGFNLADDIASLIIIQKSLVIFLSVFLKIIGIKFVLDFWLIFNPYSFPWWILTALVEKFSMMLENLIPTIEGFPLLVPIVITSMQQFVVVLKRVVFTMPYLPSEKLAVRFRYNLRYIKMYKFEGFPKLWEKYGIPNALREQWYNDDPEVIKSLMTNFSDKKVDFLPDRIIHLINNPDIDVDKVMGDTTINTSLINFNHLSINHIPSLNHNFNIDLANNQIMTIYEKLIHNL